MMREIAGGKKLAKNEELGYREISIFKDGVVL
jgi:altronate dehydratase